MYTPDIICVVHFPVQSIYEPCVDLQTQRELRLARVKRQVSPDQVALEHNVQRQMSLAVNENTGQLQVLFITQGYCKTTA